MPVRPANVVVFCAALAALGGILGGCATLGDIALPGTRPLDEATVAAGLREALQVGTDRATSRLGAAGGYLDVPALRIPLPPAMQEMAATLRGLGLGDRANDLEIAMNRAAERGAAEAVGVFAGAISRLTIQDAWAILRGGNTAATDYFRTATTAELTGRYRPILEEKLRAVGGYRQFEAISQALAAAPLVDPPDLDLIGYVTERALGGLFAELASEEQRIRREPLARTSELLQRVFGAKISN